MALRLEYSEYIRNFKNTCTLSEFYKNDKGKGLIALRHDVDHDLDLALEMARFENELKIRSTYFVLPGVSYWSEDKFLDKCLQIQDYGHEIGLHINLLAEWFKSETDDIEKSLETQINFLRNAGISLSGIAAHGDSSCYEGNFSNYWMFKELKPIDPYKEENNRTAEGPYSKSDRKLSYPKSNYLVRSDNKKFSLWSLSMKKFNLLYHAWHLNHDNYFSDSGGYWLNGKDPINEVFSSKRIQINIHPIYWKGPQRTYFFLSTARSGSLWLSTILENATSLKTRHEYILNQDFFKGNHNDKLTFYFKSLEDDPKLVESKIEEALKEYECQPENDFAEVNVYLSSFVDLLKNKFPHSVFIHLFRNPSDTIKSIMNRDWYDTPNDLNHPKLLEKNLNTKFDRVCSYVFNTNKKLFKTCDKSIYFDSISKDENNLINELESIGIKYHKRLAKNLFSKKINLTKKEKQIFKEFKNWKLYQKYKYYKYFLNLNQYVGEKYSANKMLKSDYINSKEFLLSKNRFIYLCVYFLENTTKIIFLLIRKIKKLILPFEKKKFIIEDLKSENLFIYNCEAYLKQSSVLFKTLNLNLHSYVDLFGKLGLSVSRNYYLSGEFQIVGEIDSVISIFLISYCKNDYSRRLGSVNKYRNRIEFSSAPHPNAKKINIRIHINKKYSSKKEIELKYKFHLRKHLYP